MDAKPEEWFKPSMRSGSSPSSMYKFRRAIEIASISHLSGLTRCHAPQPIPIVLEAIGDADIELRLYSLHLVMAARKQDLRCGAPFACCVMVLCIQNVSKLFDLQEDRQDHVLPYVSCITIYSIIVLTQSRTRTTLPPIHPRSSILPRPMIPAQPYAPLLLAHAPPIFSPCPTWHRSAATYA